jgi:lysophospholipase L1-like esterase
MGNKLININTNSHGMRWRESSYVKDSGKIRIAFLGDSYTFGCWSGNNSNDFVGVFDASLDKRKFETLNFGVPGYGLCDIELKIKEQVLLFKPDYLILCFFNGNDFRDTYLGVDKYDIVNGVAVLNRKLFEEKIPTPFRERLNSVSVQECKKNWIVPLTKLKIYRFLELYLAGINSKKSIDFSVNNSFNSYTFWSQKSYPEIAVKSKDLSLETLNRIWKICNENTIRLMIITIPFKEQVYSSQESGVDYDINLPQKYIEDFSKRRSILYLDLLPLLRAELKAGAKDIYYQYDEHFNEDGHRIVGNLISKYFKEKESKETNRN